ncbi:MAG: hypothetical protein JWQ71_3727 [Pedosphaera sp.]|nr:hypothetical protein [Pedosphaera sp.]
MSLLRFKCKIEGSDKQGWVYVPSEFISAVQEGESSNEALLLLRKGQRILVAHSITEVDAMIRPKDDGDDVRFRGYRS